MQNRKIKQENPFTFFSFIERIISLKEDEQIEVLRENYDKALSYEYYKILRLPDISYTGKEWVRGHRFSLDVSSGDWRSGGDDRIENATIGACVNLYVEWFGDNISN